jgi:hypothetical protein
MLPRHGLIAFFALYFDATTFKISANRLDRQLPTVAPVGDSSVPRVGPFVDFGFITAFRVPDLSDSEVILLGPEKRDGINYLAATKQVVTSGLSLTLNRHKITRGDTHSIPSHCSTKDSDGLSSST